LGGQFVSQYLVVTGKILLAGLLGGLIGFERETHGQAAGFRTNILVALGACLMMLLSLHMEQMYREFSDKSVIRLDPARIASYAIASMGFLGAGAIIKGKGSIRGLTTAACLWLVTGVGLAVGAGYVFPAALTTLVSLAALYKMRKLLHGHLAHDLHTVLTITCSCQPTRMKDIRQILSEFPQVQIMAVNYYQDLEQDILTYKMRLLSPNNIPRSQIMGALLQLPNLKRIAWEGGEVP